ncbi:cupin domain-containing protein [Morganella psychrotolerans]|uniref:Cupin n=1 Tax=Morganella psychrotolerans TaxID=368603 RepID=A0A1B8HUC8_9GAMM|nr:cupin domain-containing protein [Morganella psychrotolerans]OBU13477.1 cupin [Morganella psychrotolerans]
MGLIPAGELISYDMDLTRKEGEESKALAKFIHGTAFTMTFWTFKTGAVIPEHRHEHETLTTVLSGSLRLVVDGETLILRAGDSGLVPSWATHEAEVLEPSEVIDVYTPVREDYVARQTGKFETYLATSQDRT